ncbi:MAG: NFACT RNA binding domain-containing protein [Arcobacteraceae bacterium]
MKHYQLKAIINYLKNFKNIKHIKRVQNSTIKVEFDNRNIIYFDLTKGSTNIFKSDNTLESKSFNAPFDTILQKKLTNSSIENIELVNNDRLIRFTLNVKSSYKQERVYLQLEFTGIHTNIIILDSNTVVIEALRHISENISSRIVKVGQKLEEIPTKPFNPKEEDIEDIEKFLYDNYKQKEENELQQQKKSKINILKKEESKLQKIIASLPSLEELESDAMSISNDANILLANTHAIKPYAKEAVLYDFENNIKKFDLSQVSNVSIYINKLFAQAKKLKQKAKNLHIEKENLEQKLEFTQKMIEIVNNCKNIDELEFYMPKKEKNQTKTKKEQLNQTFFIDGYKIMLGRNERENIELLQNARASDFWFHLRDMPSAHVIVPTQKKELPQNIIEQAALLCAKFSSPFGGDYNVDYTQRRELKIQTKANVLYNNYKTIKVRVD